MYVCIKYVMYLVLYVCVRKYVCMHVCMYVCMYVCDAWVRYLPTPSWFRYRRAVQVLNQYVLDLIDKRWALRLEEKRAQLSSDRLPFLYIVCMYVCMCTYLYVCTCMYVYLYEWMYCMCDVCNVYVWCMYVCKTVCVMYVNVCVDVLSMLFYDDFTYAA